MITTFQQHILQLQIPGTSGNFRSCPNLKSTKALPCKCDFTSKVRCLPQKSCYPREKRLSRHRTDAVRRPSGCASLNSYTMKALTAAAGESAGWMCSTVTWRFGLSGFSVSSNVGTIFSVFGRAEGSGEDTRTLSCSPEAFKWRPAMSF